MEPFTVYITGKISGLPEEEFKRNFILAADFLRTQGFDPVNPLDVIPECYESCDSGLTFKDGTYQHHWQCYMKADLKVMLDCVGFFPLDNAADSRGAKVEMGVAVEVGLINVRDQLEEEWRLFKEAAA